MQVRIGEGEGGCKAQWWPFCILPFILLQYLIPSSPPFPHKTISSYHPLFCYVYILMHLLTHIPTPTSPHILTHPTPISSHSHHPTPTSSHIIPPPHPHTSSHPHILKLTSSHWFPPALQGGDAEGSLAQAEKALQMVLASNDRELPNKAEFVSSLHACIGNAQLELGNSEAAIQNFHEDLKITQEWYKVCCAYRENNSIDRCLL